MSGELRAGRTVAALAGRTVAASAAGVVLVVAPGTANAAAAPRTFQYTCAFGALSGQPMTASVVWDDSDTHVVGRPTPRLPVSASATVGALIPQTLRVAGATSLAGTAKVTAVVAAPQGNVPVTVPMDVPVTQIPSSGSMTVPANGTAPSLTFTKAGTADIVVGAIDMSITPRQADGSTTMLGTVNASCSADSGQDKVLSSFRILPRTQPQPSPTASGAGAGGGGHGSGSGAGSGSGSGAGSGAGSGSGAQGQESSGTRPGTSRSPDPTGSVTASGTASASASAASGGAPTLAAPKSDSDPRDSAQDRTAFPVPLRAAAGVLVVALAAVGSAMWFRRRGDDG
ncbi:DUF6801 domain-containing protein [Streptomyces sp. NPDC002763]|uniref:DUF6801 domain-containing protein n=1 Tax=Streptomyces sp. NPDC002763 TaxID=3154427 RepID=UPI003319DC78